MYRKLSIPVGVAMLAALALVGMLGIFAFNAAQPAQAAGIASATVMVDNVPEAMAEYTFTIEASQSIDSNNSIELTAPAGYTTPAAGTQVNITIDDGAGADSGTAEVEANGVYRVPLDLGSGNFASVISTVTIVIPDITNPAAGTHTWMVDSTVGQPMPVSATVMIGEDDGMMTDPMMDMVDVSDASVTARPDDPGDATQITVKFETKSSWPSDESITFEVTDDLRRTQYH